MIEFKLPSLGEGVESGTVLNVLVAPGDTIQEEQGLLEIEADKATVELPSPYAGKVAEVHVKQGDVVEVGQLVVSIDAEAKAEPAGAAEAKAEKARAEEAKTTAPPRAEPATAAAPAPARATTVARAPRDGALPQNGGRVPAGPAVRRLGRLLGVDLTQVHGSGERGRITAEDVHEHLRRLGAGARAGGGAVAEPALPDFERWGPVERSKISGVRRATVEAMSRAWSLIPHVTHHDLADITDMEAARKAYRAANPKGPKVTMTVVVMKAVLAALKEFPDLNASLDTRAGELIHKRYYHLGVAVDTDYGLLVPVVRDADQKSIVALADEVTDLAARARDRKLGRDEMQGATFTISNLGGIGGIGFTPIVNWPQVAILGVSRGRQEYRPGPGGPEARLLMPLSLSYDHRVIDGALAARFVKKVADLLAAPAHLLFEV